MILLTPREGFIPHEADQIIADPSRSFDSIDTHDTQKRHIECDYKDLPRRQKDPRGEEILCRLNRQGASPPLMKEAPATNMIPEVLYEEESCCCKRKF